MFIRLRYMELKDSEKNYRLIIIGEVARYFGKDVCGESLRRLFRQADKEEMVSHESSESSESSDASNSLSENSVLKPPASLINEAVAAPCDFLNSSSEAPTSMDQATKHPGKGNIDASTEIIKYDDANMVSRSSETESYSSIPYDYSTETPVEIPMEAASSRNDSPSPSILDELKNGQNRFDKREDCCAAVVDRAPVLVAEKIPAEKTSYSSTTPPLFEDKYLFESWIDRVPSTPMFTHHAGLHLFACAIEEELWAYPAIVRQTFWQTLAGAVCQEQGKRVDPAGISILSGKFISDINYQRDLLSDASEPELVDRIYRSNLKFTRADKSRFHYFDPHTEVYTGIMKVLKDWCGALKGVSKAIHMDFIHTEFGEPCFTRHADGCHDMRDRFHLCASYFKTEILGLASGEPLIYCIDRGIWGRESLRTIAANGDKIITWEKGYTKSEWFDSIDEEGNFAREKKKNSSSGKASTYNFKWRMRSWSGLPDGRKIIVRVSKNHGAEVELSIVTNCVSLAIEVIIWAMFNRWLQENDFKYLRAHFGIGMLVERLFVKYADLEATEQDRQLESRAVKALKRSKKAVEQKLSSILLKLKRKFKKIPSSEQLEKEKKRINNKLVELLSQVEKNENKKEIPLKLSNKINKYQKDAKKATSNTEKAEKKDDLEKQIKEMEHELNEIEAEITLTPKKESRLKALIEEQYVRPAFRSRALTDAIKILARNTFGHSHHPFRITYDNYREDHVMFRMVTRAPGIIVKNGNKITVTLMPSLSLQKGVYSKIRTFVQNASFKKNNKYPFRAEFKMPGKNETTSEILTNLFQKN